MGQKKRRRFKSRDGKCDVWELEDGTFEGTIGALGFGGLKLSDDFLDDLEHLCSEEEQDRRNLAGNLTRKSMGFWESGPNGYTPL